EDGIRDFHVTGVQTCALPISRPSSPGRARPILVARFHRTGTMASSPQRYRITVTPVENGGLPCQGRCSIEFEQPCGDDWMRVVESNQRLPGLNADERPALVIGARLLHGIARRHPEAAEDLLAGMLDPLSRLQI